MSALQETTFGFPPPLPNISSPGKESQQRQLLPGLTLGDYCCQGSVDRDKTVDLLTFPCRRGRRLFVIPPQHGSTAWFEEISWGCISPPHEGYASRAHVSCETVRPNCLALRKSVLTFQVWTVWTVPVPSGYRCSISFHCQAREYSHSHQTRIYFEKSSIDKRVE